jgi:hypothetical protein
MYGQYRKIALPPIRDGIFYRLIASRGENFDHVSEVVECADLAMLLRRIGQDATLFATGKWRIEAVAND